MVMGQRLILGQPSSPLVRSARLHLPFLFLESTNVAFLNIYSIYKAFFTFQCPSQFGFKVSCSDRLCVAALDFNSISFIQCNGNLLSVVSHLPLFPRFLEQRSTRCVSKSCGAARSRSHMPLCWVWMGLALYVRSFSRLTSNWVCG
jgi:hypothetical protein